MTDALCAGESQWAQMQAPLRSMANNFVKMPCSSEQAVVRGLQTSWRIENVQEMTYSQFIILLREGHVARVQYTRDMRKVLVTTSASCPGHGTGQHSVGLIYDPTLYPQLCAHGVAVDFMHAPRLQAVQDVITQTLIPLVMITLIVAWSLTLGRKVKAEDAVFGGARLQLAHDAKLSASFRDVAGIHDIKEEILEIVSFLQNKV